MLLLSLSYEYTAVVVPVIYKAHSLKAQLAMCSMTTTDAILKTRVIAMLLSKLTDSDYTWNYLS